MTEDRRGGDGADPRPERTEKRPSLRVVDVGAALRRNGPTSRSRTWQLAERGVAAGRIFYFDGVEEMREFVAALDAAIEELAAQRVFRAEGPVSLLVYLTGLESVGGGSEIETRTIDP